MVESFVNLLSGLFPRLFPSFFAARKKKAEDEILRNEFKKLLLNIDDGRYDVLRRFFESKRDALLFPAFEKNVLSLEKDGYIEILTTDRHGKKLTHANFRINDKIKDLAYEFCEEKGKSRQVANLNKASV